MDPQENPDMPVVVEPVGGGERRVMWVANHEDTALIVALGYRFARIDVRRWLAEQQKIGAKRDDLSAD